MEKPASARSSLAVSRFIATRYVSAGKRSHLVSFMSAISIVGLALGGAILIIVLSVMNGFDREMRDNILNIVPHITFSTEENLSEEEWQQLADQASANSGVSSVSTFIQVTGVIATENFSKGVLINGLDVANDAGLQSLQQFVRSGSIDALTGQRWGIVLGQTLANNLGVTVGDEVDLFSTSININPLTPLATFRSFTVSGIFRVGTQELDSELVIVNQDAARALFRLRSSANGLRLQTDNVLEANALARGMADSLPSYILINTWAQQFGAIYENIRFSRTIISFMLWLLVGVAAFNLVVSLIMIVRDKKPDIGILRTLGASPGMIARLFMWQGCLIALAGIGIGVVLGVIGALQISDLAAFVEASLGIQILNAEVYPIDFLPSQLRLGDVLVVTSGVLLLATLATLYPARRAAAIQPAEALRAD